MMKRKELLKRSLAAVLSATLAFSLAPDVGFLRIPTEVKAAADAEPLITTVYANGVATKKTADDEKMTVMGRNDQIKITADTVDGINDIVVAVSGSLPANFDFDPKTNTVFTTGVSDLSTPAVFEVYRESASTKKIILKVYAGKYQAAYYFMTVDEYNAKILSGETVEPDAFAWMQSVGTDYTLVNESPIIDASKADKEGYTLSWAKYVGMNGDGTYALTDGNSDGEWDTDTDFALSQTQIDAGEAVLFAKWTAKTYKIRYYDNEDKFDGLTIASYTGVSGTDEDTPADSNVDYYESAVIKCDEDLNLAGSEMFGSAIQDDNYGDGEGQNKIKWYFDGWTTNPNGTGTKYYEKQKVVNLISAADLDKDGAHVINLYAQWKGIADDKAYVITIKNAADNGAYKTIALDEEAAKKYTFDDNSYEHVAGKELVGWNASDGNTISGFKFVANTKSYTYKPVYQDINYTITFDANGGTGSYKNIVVNIGDKKEIGDEIVGKDKALSKFKKDNYHFATNQFATDKYGINGIKFTADQDFDAAMIAQLFGDNSKSTTLYANWEGDSYTVVFDANCKDNSGNVPTIGAPVLFGNSVSIPKNTGSLARTGYVLMGWSTDSKSTEAEYTEGDAFIMNAENKEVAKDSDSDGKVDQITLYAVWKLGTKVSYHTFNEDGDDVEICSEVVSGNAAENYKVGLAKEYDNPVKAGFTFKGWNASTVSYIESDAISAPVKVTGAEVKYYPVFKPNTITIKFDVNAPDGAEGAGSMEDEVCSLNPANTKLTAVGFRQYVMTSSL